MMERLALSDAGKRGIAGTDEGSPGHQAARSFPGRTYGDDEAWTCVSVSAAETISTFAVSTASIRQQRPWPDAFCAACCVRPWKAIRELSDIRTVMPTAADPKAAMGQLSGTGDTTTTCRNAYGEEDAFHHCLESGTRIFGSRDSGRAALQISWQRDPSSHDFDRLARSMAPTRA